jgi:hypothetical protein
MSITINGSTGVAGNNGTAGTPTYQGEDTNTGIFFPAADTVAVATAGVEVARIDSSGNLGIGTTSPGVKLEVSSAADLFRLRTSTARGGGNGYMSFNDPTGRKAYLGYGGADDGFIVANEMNAPMLFLTNATERARIDASGNLLMGTTDPGTDYVRFACNGQTRNQLGLISLDNVANNGFVMFRTSNGTLIGGISRNGSTNAVLYATTSDYRLKESVADLSDGLSRVMALRPVSWVWKDCDGETGEGFIAHEVQDVVPAAVSGEKDAVEADGSIKAQGMDASYLVATLVKAIQEQQALITELTARVAQLEAQ